ncbi:MAG: glycyl-radical enzyme activating protein [Acidobacteria bacterium]|nr:glycyl-radical enzyme activating protein [Acidobacteriota bacterium]
MTGNVLKIERFAVHDGPGIRTTVFLKGCPLRCTWCHSPESQTAAPELMFRQDRCIGCGECVDDCRLGAIRLMDGQPVMDVSVCRRCGDCAEGCPTGARTRVGSVMTESQVLQEIAQDTIFFDQSGGGVTFSGGEPLMQAEFLMALLDGCRARRIHTAVDTCGAAPSEALARVADRADLLLFDLKHLDDARHRQLTGSSNVQILANLAALADRTANVIVRFPLVPEVNDGSDHIAQLGRFVRSIGLSRIDVLPYHRAGSGKYPALGREYALSGSEPPSGDDRARAVRILTDCGLQAAAGGRP